MLITGHREVHPLSAHIVRAVLASEGVAATVHSEHHIMANWSRSLALGQLRIQVQPSQAEQARAVLAAWREGAFERALAAQFDLPADACPRCGAVDWRYRRSWAFALTLSLLACGFGAVLPPPIIGRRCGSCGQREANRASENDA